MVGNTPKPSEGNSLALPSFLSTPRSMMAGSWGCESPRVYPDPSPRQTMSADGGNKNTLSIEIPKLDEPKAEERDAPSEHDTSGCNDNGQPNQRNKELPPLAGAAAETSSALVVHGSKFECDYDQNPTAIFLNLQKKEWEAAAKKADESVEEARTWVSRKEKGGKLRWRLLPIHAAIIFKAPENVVETLLAAYPKGAQSKDDQGMLPLHLAFRHGSSEGTVNLLLVAFPQSVNVQDRKGRIPLVLAQASASPNRDAFVRALERGPTYYANAAAATERAAVTAEQRALFDAKLIEVEKKHMQDTKTLKAERKGLEESVEHLQKELAKQKGATQVLVDHVNSLEAQLKSKTETERFLAVKAATLDTDLKEMEEAKAESEAELKEELAALKQHNKRLQRQMEGVQISADACDELSSEEYRQLKDKAHKQEKELKSLKMDWASAQARAAVLEAQLKNKIENEHELASQVSQLASRLAEANSDNGNVAQMYTKRIQLLEDERERLRATVNDLGKKLLKVSQFMHKMTQKTQETSKKASQKSQSRKAKLLADASSHEALIRSGLAERQRMAALLKKQEEEMEKSAKQHQEILDKLAEMKSAPTMTEEGDDLPFSYSMAAEMEDVMTGVLGGVSGEGQSGDSEDMIESILKNVVVPVSSKEGREVLELFQRNLKSRSSESEEDPQKCLEDALRALELSRTKSVQRSGSEDSEDSDESRLTGNPSDEESNMKMVDQVMEDDC